jgi:hypothetical protein
MRSNVARRVDPAAARYTVRWLLRRLLEEDENLTIDEGRAGEATNWPRPTKTKPLIGASSSCVLNAPLTE